ncbi:MAG: hypothetical protein HKN03_03375 [Acidimicrobiales bacterium]|nr:hypothetical protein [Acidimicrobiales bacterium]
MATGVQEQSASPSPTTDGNTWLWMRSAIGVTGAIVIASTLVAIGLPLVRNWIDLEQDDSIDRALEQASSVGESGVYDVVLERWLAAEASETEDLLQPQSEKGPTVTIGAVEMPDVVGTDLMVLRAGDTFIASYPANSFSRQHCVYLRLYPHSYTVDTLQGECNADYHFVQVP